MLRIRNEESTFEYSEKTFTISTKADKSGRLLAIFTDSDGFTTDYFASSLLGDEISRRVQGALSLDFGIPAMTVDTPAMARVLDYLEGAVAAHELH